MNLVMIESPFKTDPDFGRAISTNILYAQCALRHSLGLGETPIATHLLYTQVLDDTNQLERERGLIIGRGLILQKADLVAVYGDLGVSSGMESAMDQAKAANVPMEFRTIPDWPAFYEKYIKGRASLLAIPSVSALGGLDAED